MSDVYLIRKRNGRAEGMSVSLDAYANIDTEFFDVITDPSTPDGVGLEPPKVWDNVNLRNAAQSEIDIFDADEAADNTLIERKKIKQGFDQGGSRKLFRAIMQVSLDEINILRALQSPVLPARTMSQAVTAVKNIIDSGANE